jgi:hypothetical protein
MYMLVALELYYSIQLIQQAVLMERSRIFGSGSWHFRYPWALWQGGKGYEIVGLFACIFILFEGQESVIALSSYLLSSG